jgi:predicted site-specific integrase-resolvase
MPSTNGHGPKRAILYARVSTVEQARSGYSLAQQLEALREYAARKGYEVLEEVSRPWTERREPGAARYGPYEGPRGRRWCVAGTRARQGPLRA